jgi:hypothetical protein
MTVMGNEALFSTVIKAEAGSNLKIHGSTFRNNFSYEKAAVLMVRSSTATVSIMHSEFINNAAIDGGVFDVSNGGSLECTNCTIQDNFAIESGVITATSNGRFLF